MLLNSNNHFINGDFNMMVAEGFSGDFNMRRILWRVIAINEE